MFSLDSETEVGNLSVTTTNHRGHTVEEVAEMATNRLVSISDTFNDRDWETLIFLWFWW